LKRIIRIMNIAADGSYTVSYEYWRDESGSFYRTTDTTVGLGKPLFEYGLTGSYMINEHPVYYWYNLSDPIRKCLPYPGTVNLCEPYQFYSKIRSAPGLGIYSEYRDSYNGFTLISLDSSYLKGMALISYSAEAT
jgi:hypothetical protein